LSFQICVDIFKDIFDGKKISQGRLDISTYLERYLKRYLERYLQVPKICFKISFKISQKLYLNEKIDIF